MYKRQVHYADEQDIGVNVYLEDWSNGMKDSPEYVFQLMDGLKQTSIRRYMLPDTLGILNPLQVIEYMRKMKKRYPNTHFDFHAHNDYDLAVSNVLGSNIFNLLVVLGACSLIQPVQAKSSLLKKEFPFSIICAILLAALGAVGMTLGRIDGIVFLVIFAVYLCLMIVSAKNARNEALNKELEEEVDEEIKILPVWQCIVYIIGGAVAIKFGGDFVVDGASTIATGFGISQNLIGLTIVALGTSLPELVTSIVAAKKNEVDMALGNVIGSNIFNILLVLGVAGAISPVAFVTENLIDIAILVVMSVVVWIFAWSKKKLVNWHGAVMLVSYVAYLVYICIR